MPLTARIAIKHTLLGILFLCALAADAQSSTSSAPPPALTFPTHFPELVTLLPTLHYKMDGQFPDWFGGYCDALDKALHSEPDSVPGAIPAIAKNLQNSIPQVQQLTLLVLYSVSFVRPDYRDLVKPLLPQIESALSSGNEPTQIFALEAVHVFLVDAPEDLARTLEDVASAPQTSKKVTDGYLEYLIAMRPYWMVDHARDPALGRKITDMVVQEVRRDFVRDEALTVAIEIGPTALAPLRDDLTTLLHDSTASEKTHQLARKALDSIPAS